MEILCTRPGCPRPRNVFADLDNPANLKTAQQKYCITCGMPLILAGRYLPIRLLGKGGFGAAFLARDRYTPTMRQCVVKQFQPSGNLTAQQLEIAQGLFEREAEVLEQLGNRHEQIPDLFAFFPLIVPNPLGGKDDQFFYLVQEYIEGQTLEEELAAKGHFSEAEIRLILDNLLKVLRFIHDRGSIHRDIKPSNIMRGKDGRLYLLDFGAVKQVTSGAGSSAAAQSTGIYSMGFAPPEQMAGAQVYPATDLYALAATCVHLLTGKPSDALYDAYHNCWNWRPHISQVSDRLAAILDKMLLPSPKDRFQSAEEVLLALNPAAKVSTTTLQPPPIPPSPAPASPAGTPSPPQPMQPASPPAAKLQPRQNPFSLGEVLGIAAFTGFEGALLFIAARSLLPSPGLGMGIWGICLGLLVFAQYRRIIEKIDLLIIALITLGLVWILPNLHALFLTNKLEIIVVASLAGAAAITVTTLFRLIYQLLSRIL
jgi:serine/threonine-protein kinase